MLGMVGRAIVRRGECIFLIDVDADGLRLTPATSWEVTGGPEPESWTYRLQLAGPSRTRNASRPPPGLSTFDPM